MESQRDQVERAMKSADADAPPSPPSSMAASSPKRGSPLREISPSGQVRRDSPNGADAGRVPRVAGEHAAQRQPGAAPRPRFLTGRPSARPLLSLARLSAFVYATQRPLWRGA